MTMTADQNGPTNYSALPPIMRLEMLVGLLFDQLAPARELIAQLKLRANASHATRSDLALLSESSVSIDQQLRQLREEIQDLKKSLPAPDEEKKGGGGRKRR